MIVKSKHKYQITVTQEEEMKIRQALINLSENKLEEMNKNIREAIIQKAAEALQEKKIEVATKLFVK